jgi:hypothetical protein
MGIAEDVHFRTVHDGYKVVDALVDAQEVILNPTQGKLDRNFGPLGHGNGGEKDFEIKFSPNVIRIDVSTHSTILKTYLILSKGFCCEA